MLHTIARYDFEERKNRRAIDRFNVAFENILINLVERFSRTNEEWRKYKKRQEYYTNVSYQNELLHVALDQGTLERKTIQVALDKWNYNKEDQKELLKTLDNLTFEQNSLYEQAIKSFTENRDKSSVSYNFSNEMYRLSDQYTEEQNSIMDHTIKNANFHYSPDRLYLNQRAESERLDIFQYYIDSKYIDLDITAEMMEARYKKTPKMLRL